HACIGNKSGCGELFEVVRGGAMLDVQDAGKLCRPDRALEAHQQEQGDGGLSKAAEGHGLGGGEGHVGFRVQLPPTT
ncbi:unnamed protein product, partial [marine sediment metagenome]